MIELSDDKTRLNIDRVHRWLASSYWAPGIARETVERAIDGSHCLGGYEASGTQISFARMVTDHTTFAWLADVWVDEAARGRGIGRAMVRWFLDHPQFRGIRRVGLTTLDAHGLYETLGFHSPLRPERYMERLDPAFQELIRLAES